MIKTSVLGRVCHAARCDDLITRLLSFLWYLTVSCVHAGPVSSPSVSIYSIYPVFISLQWK